MVCWVYIYIYIYVYNHIVVVVVVEERGYSEGEWSDRVDGVESNSPPSYLTLPDPSKLLRARTVRIVNQFLYSIVYYCIVLYSTIQQPPYLAYPI